MKRKLFDLRVWHRTLDAGTQTVHRLPGGLLVDYRAGEVVKPLIVPFGGRTYCILNTDYRWVHYVPAGARHALTVQLDDSDQVQQLYVDIIQGSGTGKDGLPWIDDLYLDVAGVVEISPDGTWTVRETEVLDEDELYGFRLFRAGIGTAPIPALHVRNPFCSYSRWSD